MPEQGMRRHGERTDHTSTGLARFLALEARDLAGSTPKLDGVVSETLKNERLRGHVIRLLEAIDAQQPAAFAISGIDDVCWHQAETVPASRRGEAPDWLGCQFS